MPIFFVLILFVQPNAGYGTTGASSIRVGAYDIMEQCQVQGEKLKAMSHGTIAASYCIPVNHL